MLELIAANKRRAASVVGIFVAITLVLGTLIGLLAGSPVIGLVAAAVVAALMVVLAYSKADTVVLRVSRAVPADPDEHKRLFNIVDGLCIASGLPRPRVLVVADPAMNALATGIHPRRASLVVTTGLLERLNRVELEGVVAHQLARIRNHDTLAPTLNVLLLGSLPLAAELALRTKWWNGGRSAREGDREPGSNPVSYLGLLLLGCSAGLARLLRSTAIPGGDSLADVAACQLTRYPPGLVSALECLSGAPTVTHSAMSATAQLWMAQPLSGVGDNGQFAWFHQLASTHTPLEERIALLREL